MMDYATSSARTGGNNSANNVGDGGKAVRRTLLMSNSPQPFNIPASLLQNSNINSNSSMNPSTYSADRKLYEQFNFFKEEFIKTAIKMDIAIPIDLVEEGKSSNLRFFLENNGPKYIFSVIQSHINEVQIMRSGLSLVIITIALFKRHLPRALDGHHPFYYEGSRLGSPQPLTADELWATQVISKITDSVSVPGCVSILISTHNPVIQELVINLIAALISISDDCITQLLLVPNILYTQTNKKIPNTENNREKLLYNQLRKIASRLSPSNSNSNLDAGGPLSSGHETRRNSASPNPAGENTGGRQSFRFERSNSKQRAGTAGGKGDNEYDNDDMNSNDPEEFQSCLSYIFSIVLMQKNRHLLLAGCADIIISMSKSSASSSLLCEFIAKVPTSPLPMIDFNKNENKNRGHSLKHLYTNQPQQSFEPLHVNPLGARILDWAGIRIPLKFLQRYHQIFGTSTSISQGNRSKSIVAAASTSNNPPLPSGNASVSSSTESILNDNIKNEYRYAHNRALLAVCSLLVASHDIVVYAVSLQGAMEVIKLSAAIYSDDEMNQSRSGPTGSSAHHHHHHHQHEHFGSVGGGGMKGKNRLDLHHSNLPSVIVTALNALQLEKQHQHRMKAMINHSLAVGGSLGSNSNSRRSSTTNSAAAALAVQQQQQANQQSTRNLKSRDASLTNTSSSNPPSRSPEHNRFLANKLKPLTQQNVSSTDQKSLLQHLVTLQKTSNPSQQNLAQSIPLSSSIEMKFDGSFTKENEKYQLYIQNQNDAKLYQQSLASDLQYYAAKQISSQNKGPLQFYNLPNEDSLLNTSLQAIEQQTQENLLQPPKRQQVKSPVMFSSGLEGSTSIYLESNSLSQSDTKLNLGGDPSNENHGLTMKSAPGSPYHTTSASRDFFGNLPSKPHLPQRIEPKDVIVKDESMSRIRKKFQLLAENAVKQIESSGKNY
jgi:hypothetical protein